jgi:hypothetical protein
MARLSAPAWELLGPIKTARDYVVDVTSPLPVKMLYASSRETLKKELGSALIGAEITAAVSRPPCSLANGRAEAPARVCAVPAPASPLGACPG